MQFGFHKDHSTSHTLIDLTENIRKALRIFIDLQKAFDTVDHNILLQKLHYYGIRGVTNNWLSHTLQTDCNL